MSFPSSPTNGASATVNGIGYVYSSALTAWTRVPGAAPTATNTVNVLTISTASNANFYPTFVSSNNSTAAYMTEYTTSSFYVNPGAGNLYVGNATQQFLFSVNSQYSGPSIVPNGSTNILYLGPNGTKTVVGGNGSAYAGTLAVRQISGQPAFTVENAASSAIYLYIDSSGNVGIGTTTPTYKLQVAGTTYITNSYGDTNTENAYRLKFNDNGGIQNDTGIGLAGSSGSETMWFNALAGFYFAVGTGGEKLRITSNGGISFGASGTAYGTSGQILQSNGDASPTWISTGSLVASNAVAVQTVLTATNASFYPTFVSTNNTTPTTLFHYTTSSVVINPYTGNVGIGTTSLVAKLTVVGGTSNASDLATAYSTAALNITPKSSSGYSLAFGSGPNDRPYIQMSAAGTAPNDIMIQPYGGYVGIGTSYNNVYDQVAAQRPLVVQSSATSTTLNGSSAAITIVNGDTTTNNTAQLNFAAITGASTNQYSSAIISAIFGARTNAQYPTGQLVFSVSSTLNSAPTEKMRIDSSGNVGIGTNSNPGTPVSGRLSVLPAANPTTAAASTTLTLGETTNNSAYQLRMAYSYLSSVYTGVIDAVQNSVGAPLSINPTGGNVGIGATAPIYKLDVGPVNATQATNAGASGLIRNASGADLSPGTQARIIVYGGTGVDSSNWGYFGYDSNGLMKIVYGKSGSTLAQLAWGTTSASDGTGTFTETMRLDNNGRLGIGTTSPSALLHVSSGTNAILNYQSGTWAAKIFQQNDATTYNGLIVGNRWASDTSTVFEAGSLYGSSSAWGSFYKITGAGTHIWGSGNSGTERLRITSNGGISFGASGTAYGTSGQILQSNGDAAPTWISTGTLVASNAIAVQTVLTATNASFYPTFVSTNNATPTSLFHYTTSTFQVNPYTGYVGIGGNGASDQLYIYRAGTGNNGLTVASSSGTNISLSANRGSGGNSPLTQAGDASIIYSAGAVDTGSLVIGQWSNSSRGMRIDSSGQVGIGTSPTNKLTIAGGITEIRDGGYLMIRPSGNTNDTRLVALSNNGLDVVWGGATAVSLMRWENGGNISINTSTVVSRFHVANSYPTGLGTLPAGAVITQDQSTGNNLHVFRNSSDNGTYAGIAMQDNNIGGYVVYGNGGASDQMFIAGYSGGQLQYGTADSVSPSARTTQLSWTSTGVGIGAGNTSPTAKLHVQGTGGGGYATTNKIILQRTDATNCTGSIEFQGSAGHASPYWNILTDGDTTNDFGFAYNGTKILNLLTSGNIRIPAGDLGLDAGRTIFFGKEESFGGTDTGGADWGYITFDNNNTTYGPASGTTEASCLRIGSSNDGTGVNSDNIAIEPAADLFLRSTVGGSVYVGTYAAKVFSIDMSGNVIAKAEITAYGTASDVRLKENIVKLEGSLLKVQKLQGYNFNYIGKEDKLLGVVAQEIEQVVPEVVYEFKDFDGEYYKAVRYEHLTVLLIEAMNEQQAIIERQQKQIDQIQAMLAELLNK